jgi:2-succinyl-6-hydroxy-2,4-cyclohexadiene-1-carboxylate synthase
MVREAVLLHGFTGSAVAWGDLALDGLRVAGLAPAPIDLPGHGRLADTAVTTLAETLALVDGAVLEAGPHLTTLVGYSMGGRIALHYALRTPRRIERLVLESASPGLRTESERTTRRVADAAQAERIVSRGVEAFVDEWEALPLFASQRALPESVRADIRDRRLRNRPDGLAAALIGLGTGTLPSLWSELAALDVPVLLITGERDTAFVDVARRMAASLPNARLVVVPHVGHAVHLEAPEAWAQAVGDFATAS